MRELPSLATSTIFTPAFLERMELLARHGAVDVQRLEVLLSGLQELLGNAPFRPLVQQPMSRRGFEQSRFQHKGFVRIFTPATLRALRQVDHHELPCLKGTGERGPAELAAVWLEDVLDHVVFGEIFYTCTENNTRSSRPAEMLEHAAARANAVAQLNNDVDGPQQPPTKSKHEGK